MEIKSWNELHKKKSRRRIKRDREQSKTIAIKDMRKQQMDEGLEKIDEVHIFPVQDTPQVDAGTDTKISAETDETKERIWEEWTANNLTNDIMKKPRNITSTYRSKPKRGTAKNSKVKWVVVVVLLLAALTVAVGALRFAVNDTDGQDLTLVISGPERIAVGEEVVWTITYHNVGKVDLERLELTMKYPSGFKLVSADPEATNDFSNIWDLGDLAVGEEEQVVVRGQIFGEEEDVKSFYASLVYQPANFSSDFVKDASLEVTLANSLISIDIEQPDNILPETEYDWKITVNNLSSETIDDWQVTFVTLPGFIMSDPVPEDIDIQDTAEHKEYTWKQNSLWANKSRTFMFTGDFPVEARGINELKVIVKRKEGDEYKIIQEKSWNAVILGEEMLLTMKINGADTLDSVNPGEAIAYQVSIKNTAGKDLKDLTVGLKLTPEFIDWSTLKAPGVPEQSADGWVKLSQETFDELETLPAGEELVLDFSVQVKEQVLDSANKLKSYMTVKVGKVGDEEKDDLDFSTRVVSTEVRSQAKFRSEANYYDDEGVPVGSGPLPPVAGETTEFIIVWTARTNVGDFDSASVSATLPQAVIWQGVQTVDQGSVNYDAVGKQIIWNIGKLQTSDGAVQAVFKVSITPEFEKIGSVINLLSVATMQAVTGGQNITLTGPVLNTNLDGALFGSGQGTVQSP